MDILLRKVVRDLTRRRVRTALTLLGIIVGVAGLVAVSATARQLAIAQRSVTAALDQPDMVVRTAPVAPEVPSAIGRQLGATVVEGRTVVEAGFSDGGPWRACLLIGLHDSGLGEHGLHRPEVVTGRMPENGEVAFDQGVAALADVGIGDIVAFRAGAGAPVAYLTVVGLTRTPAALDAAILNRVNAYALPREVAALTGDERPNQLLLRLSDPDRADGAERLATLLDRRGIAHGPVVRADESLVGERELRTVIWLLLAFSILGLVLSAFLVANTVSAIVHDELGQIGVLKALGADRRRVVGTYLMPALLLGTIATVLGYASGLAGGQAIVAFLASLLGYPTPAITIAAREVALAASVGLAVPLLAAVAPVLLGSRAPVVRLLRTYGLAGPRGGRIGRLRWREVGRRWPLMVLGASNALRRRLRAGITVALIAVAVAAAVAAQALSASLETTVATLYDRYGADAWIAFDAPVDPSLAARLAREPGVAAAEVWARASGEARNESVDLWGVPRRTDVYRHRVVAGTWLGAGGRAAVASSNLARRLDVQPGQTLPIDIDRETRDVTIVGVVDDESTYLGSTSAGKLFLAPETLASFGGEPAFSFLAVAFDRHEPTAVETAIAALEERYAELRPRSYAAYSDKASTARTIDVLVLLLRAMVLLVSAIGLIGVVNTLAMGVAERRREIGVARALGARHRHVTTLLVVEGLVLGGAGYGGGLVLGYPLARILVRMTGGVLFRLSFHLPLSFLIAAFGATLAACAFAGLGPAVVAARVRPVAVLRYE